MEKVIVAILISTVLLFILSSISLIMRDIVIYLINVMNISLAVAIILVVVILIIDIRIISVIIKHYVKK